MSYTDPDRKFTYTEAYWRIEDGNGTLGTNFVQGVVRIYATADSAAQGGKALRERTVTFDPDDLNRTIPLAPTPLIFRDLVVTAMYAMLKARAEFAQAVDV